MASIHKGITLSRQAIRVLADTLPVAREGLSRDDLHQLEDAENKLRDALGLFGERLAELDRDAKAAIRAIRAAGYSRDGVERINWINAALADDLEELVATAGRETTEVLLTPSELHFTTQAFSSIDKWKGQTEMRRWVFEIEEALKKENVREVRVELAEATAVPDKLDQAIARNGHASKPKTLSTAR